MAKILSGKEVVASLNQDLKSRVQVLKDRGIVPCLGIVRVGQREDDIAYERGAGKRAETIGIKVNNYVLPGDCAQEDLIKVIKEINADPLVHGVLLFRPLPKHIDDQVVRNTLAPEKDADGITDVSMAGLYGGTKTGYPPCTAEACIAILDHYGVELKGKKVTVIGRSLVIGKPVSMLLLGRDATPTICHTKTKSPELIAREAEILIVAAGKEKVVGPEYLNPGQTVIDVGIHLDSEGKFSGDVDFQNAEPIVSSITPVPGGTGTVTTSILMKHIVESAEKL